MKKVLIIVGSSGALGSGITEYFSNSPFAESIYCFGKEVETKGNVHFLRLPILPINTSQLFEMVPYDKEAEYFLISTVGGFSAGKSVSDTPPEEFLEMINKNYLSSLNIVQSFLSRFKESAGGSICFVTSYSSFYPQKDRAAYDVSKSSLNALVKHLAEELPKDGYSVNAIAPMLIDTPANREWVPLSQRNELIRPDETASLIEGLFNHSHFVNGNIILLKSRIRD